MDRIKATMLLAEIKGYLTAGNPVWHKEVVAEALDIAIEALQEQSRDCMWVCPNCGLDVHVDYNRCVRCGERREP